MKRRKGKIKKHESERKQEWEMRRNCDKNAN